MAKTKVTALGKGCLEIQENQADLHEAKLLQLDSSKAKGLGWQPVWDFETTIEMTVDWYEKWANGEDAQALCLAQIKQFSNECEVK